MAEPIIPWIGGKRRLADKILPMFPEHLCYVEPLAGAAALLFMKEPSKVEVLNDVNGELINLYRVIQRHLEEFMRQFKWALSSREIFRWQQTTPPDTLTDIQRAARFYYLQKLCFGGRVEKRSFGASTTTPPRLNLMRIEEDLSQAHMRLTRVTIERLDWRECVTRYDRPHTLFYLDPPYWGTEGYGVDFPFEQYAALADTMRSMKGKAIISVNDVPEMRRTFAGMATKRVAIRYTVGGRQGPAERGELIIRNWPSKGVKRALNCVQIRQNGRFWAVANHVA